MDAMADRNLFAIRLVVMGVAMAVCGHAQDQPAALAFEEGIASWYGPSFDGQRAASGEIFDSGQLTAAHRTLPFGTKVRVRRVGTADSIVVRINDRGPFVESRIIDLSYAAARQLGVTDPGLFRVALEVLERGEGAPPPRPFVPQTPLFFTVQVGAFRNPDNARRTRDLMQEKFGAAGPVTMERVGEFWCVLVGNTASQAEAETLAGAVRKSGDAYRSAYVVPAGQ
jgi:rare lipoprotein A